MPSDVKTVEDINLLAEYLSDNQLQDLSSTPADCIVICASAILHQAEVLFQRLESNPSVTKFLVLCGGIGHSTELIYEAVAAHPRFSSIANEFRGLPEALFLGRILTTFYDRDAITSKGCHILAEDKSTNCGQNAMFTRQVLEKAGLSSPESCIIIQDPTMMKRTRASFEKAYEGISAPPRLISCPLFVPRMQINENGELAYDKSMPNGLWANGRFLELVVVRYQGFWMMKMDMGPWKRDLLPMCMFQGAWRMRGLEYEIV